MRYFLVYISSKNTTSELSAEPSMLILATLASTYEYSSFSPHLFVKTML